MARPPAPSNSPGTGGGPAAPAAASPERGDLPSTEPARGAGPGGARRTARARRFMAALARRAPDPVVALPPRLAPLARALGGTLPFELRAGPASAAALAAAGRPAATVGRVIHLARRPGTDAGTAAVVAHELVHAAARGAGHQHEQHTADDRHTAHTAHTADDRHSARTSAAEHHEHHAPATTTATAPATATARFFDDDVIDREEGFARHVGALVRELVSRAGGASSTTADAGARAGGAASIGSLLVQLAPTDASEQVSSAVASAFGAPGQRGAVPGALSRSAAPQARTRPPLGLASRGTGAPVDGGSSHLGLAGLRGASGIEALRQGPAAAGLDALLARHGIGRAGDGASRAGGAIAFAAAGGAGGAGFQPGFQANIGPGTPGAARYGESAGVVSPTLPVPATLQGFALGGDQVPRGAVPARLPSLIAEKGVPTMASRAHDPTPPTVFPSSAPGAAEVLEWIIDEVEQRVLAELERRGRRHVPEVF